MPWSDFIRTLGHDIFNFTGFFIAVGALLCLFFERQALKRRDVPGSPSVLRRRDDTLFCGRVFLNLISAFCLVVIFGLSVMRYFESHYVSDIYPCCNIYYVFSQRLLLAFFSTFYPLSLIFLLSLKLIKQNKYSLWLWLFYYGAVGVITVAVYFLLFFVFNPSPDFFADNFIFLVLAFVALMGTGILMWVFFVHGIMKERGVSARVQEIEMGFCDGT